MNRRMFVCAVVLSLLASAISAQTLRRHDADRAAVAKDATEKFTAVSTGDASIFTKMLANVEALDERDFALLAARNQATVEATATTIPAKTWAELRKDLDDESDGTMTRYAKAASAVIAPGQDSIKRLDALAAAAADARTKVQAELKAVEDRDAAEQPTVEEFEKAVTKVRDGSQAEGLSDLAELTKTIPESLKVLRSAIDSLGEAPGLHHEKLQLALDVATSERDRTRQELRFAKERVERATRMEQHIAAATALAGRVRTEFAKHESDEPTVVTLRQLAAAAKKDVTRETDLRTALEALAGFVALSGYHLLAVNQLAVEEASAAVRHSVEMSAINSAEHASFIRHGLSGVSAYYAGGLKSEDVANFIDAVQTIVIGILAGRD